MAHYEHLPIYKKAMDLVVYFEQVVKNFSRYHKYTLGTELRNTSKEVTKLIIRANSQREKMPSLMELRERLEEMKVLVRVAKEVKAFRAFRSFQHAITLVVKISRQRSLFLGGILSFLDLT